VTKSKKKGKQKDGGRWGGERERTKAGKERKKEKRQ